MQRRVMTTTEGRTGNVPSRGFTFVEVLVVIALMVILAAVTTAALSNYMSRQSLTNLKQEVIEVLENAKRDSLAARNDTTHGVFVGTASIARFSGDSYAPAAVTEVIDTRGKVTATSSFADDSATVVFNRLTGTPSTSGTITFFDSVNQTYATITIHASGLIE